MKIHAHIITWNEEKLLPFTLRHYLQFCEKVYIWDNYSDDRTNQIIADHNQSGRIVLYRFDTGGKFDDMTNIYIKNNAWKQSKGKADFAVVCDCDELVYHPDIASMLNRYKDSAYFTPDWHEMVSEEFPEDDGGLITDKVKRGVRGPHGKMLLFRTDVGAVNWSVGAHDFKPEPGKTIAVDSRLKTLHYKYLSADYVIERYGMTSSRFSPVNLHAGFGRHHTATAEDIIKNHQNMLKNSVKVI